MKFVDAEEVTRKTFEEVARTGEAIVVTINGDAVVKLTSAAAEVKKRAAFFLHFPHDPAECLSTCWRHNGAAEREAETEKKKKLAVR